ncbi:MAG: hypothetical protein APR53_05900 [Methanoculleus sp. SDB]|nr:MAG: hypothetical protein APR53_05900 [Methanoculleus sp. SDB]
MTTCESAQDAIRLLSGESFDAIISDYLMPGMDGIRFLQHLREHGDETPFIIFTGKGREDVVIEALNSGADFYLQKGGDPKAQFLELSKKIQYAVARKRSEMALRESEAFLDSIFSSIQDGISVLDRSFTIIKVNRTMEEWYSREMPLIGRKCWEAYRGLSERCEPCPSYQALQTDRPAREIVPMVDAGTTIGWIDLYSFPLVDSANGETVGVIEYVRNITAEKQAQDELKNAYEQISAAEERLRGQYEELAAAQAELQKQQQQLEEVTGTVPGVVYQFYIRSDGSMGFHYVSGRAQEVLGLSSDPTDFFGRFTAQVDPRDREALLGSINTAVRSRSPWDFEGRFVKSSGETIWFQGQSRPLDRGNELVYSGLLTDITDRKRAEEELVESEERYRIIVETANEGIWTINADFITTFTNRKMREMFGYSAGEMLGHPVWDFVPAEEVESMKQSLHQRRTGKPGRYERQWRRKDGSTVWCLTSATPLFSPEGTFLGSFGMFTDITERRRTEQALRDSEEKYRTLVETTGDFIWEVDTHGIYTYVSPQVREILGYEPDEMIGKTPFDFMPPAEVRRVAAEFSRSAASYLPIANLENACVRKDGRTIILETSGVPKREKDGGYIGYRGIDRDITERKKAKEQLHSRQVLLDAVLDSTDNGILVVSDSGEVRTMNRRFRELWRIPEDLFASGNDVALLAYVADQLRDPEAFLAEVKRPYATDEESRSTIRFRDGRIFERYSRIVRREGRQHRLWSFRDITEQKRTEDALRENENRLRLVTDNMVDLITRIDRNRTVVYCSPSAERVTGYPAAYLIGHTVTEFIHPDDTERVIRQIRAAIGQHLPSVRLEYRYRTKQGDCRWFESETRILYDKSGEYDGAIFTIRDITDRKQAGETLRESEERYRSVIENIEDGFFRTDREGRVVMVSPSAVRMTGHASVEAAIGVPMVSIYRNPDARDTLLDMMRKQGSVRDYEVEIRKKDGSVFWGSISAHYLYDESGAVNGTEGIIRDITERKNMENALRLANRKLLLLGSTSRHDIINQLTVLQGYLELLEMKLTDPSAAQLYDRITSAAQRIAAILQFTKEYENIGVRAPVWKEIRTLVETAAGQVVPANVKVVCDIPARCEVFADPLIARVFYTLMDNAVRHGTPIGTIRFSVQKTGDDCRIVCEDDGAGILADEKEKIFAKGFGKGTGLGLFLAREILAITGITIRENGEPGKGARFEIVVPEGMYRIGGRDTPGAGGSPS